MLGSTLAGKYELIRLLGKGGMGSVYEARHTGTRRRVAVKVIDGRLLEGGGDGARRFRREARAAGALESEHIVQILDAGEDAATGTLYLVMECLQGEDLQGLLDRSGPIAPPVALRIAAQALLALQRAHEAGIVHRDIKPANLFLARREGGVITVKLLDFGIAKITEGPLGAPLTAGLTSTGGFLGSPLYMSPEQVLSSRDAGPASDLWSLGSTLYCALAGRAPHQDVATFGRLVIAICAAPPRPIREIAPWVSAEVEAIVLQALRLDAAQRYPSAAAMIEAIRALTPGGFALDETLLPPLSRRAPAVTTTSLTTGSGATGLELATTAQAVAEPPAPALAQVETLMISTAEERLEEPPTPVEPPPQVTSRAFDSTLGRASPPEQQAGSDEGTSPRSSAWASRRTLSLVAAAAVVSALGAVVVYRPVVEPVAAKEASAIRPGLALPTESSAVEARAPQPAPSESAPSETVSAVATASAARSSVPFPRTPARGAPPAAASASVGVAPAASSAVTAVPTAAPAVPTAAPPVPASSAPGGLIGKPTF